MQSDAFAAQRREQLVAGDDRLGPIVAEALSNLGADGWADPIVDAAGRIWLENYAAEAPDAAYRAGLMRFRQRVAESLEKTTELSNAERITRWLSTYAVNAGTIQGAYRRGVRFKTWVDMEDAAVRDAHRHAAGQVVPIGGAFMVGGVKMGYPGEPVGPIELWINCRCVAQPAARSGETMSENTLDLGSNAHTRALVADAGAEEPRTGALVVLLPADDDPITAATSEDQAHMTFVWMGDVSDIDDAARAAIGGEVSSYATALDGPIVVPVMRRGQLGDDGAEVVFLERSDSLLAARDGLMESSPNLLAAHDAAEQFPEWTPHVTLGYPEGVEGGPAVGEYDGTEVTFDRLGLWLGGDYTEYPMGGVVSDTIIADAAAQEPGIPAEEYEADDELEDDDEPITEIPVHGVLAPEGVETGDGRGFREGAISSRPLPYPLRLEVVGTHGGTTSDVVTVGRIDEAWRDDATGMWRFRGAIILSKPQASAAIEGIIDGSGTGVSIDADAMAVDMEGFSDEAVVTAEAAGKNPTTWFSETRIAGLTIVPIPAFHEAYVALGHDFVEDMTEEQITAAAGILEDCGCGEAKSKLATGGVVPPGTMALFGESGSPGYVIPKGVMEKLSAFAPTTRDGPGWITHPIPTSRIRRYWVRGEGAAKIRWGEGGDFNRCRAQLAKYVQNPEWLAGLCANMHREALGIWPAQHKASARIETYASAQVDSKHVDERVSILVAGGEDRRVLAVARHADDAEARQSLRRVLDAITWAGEGAQGLVASAGGVNPAWHDAGSHLREYAVREPGTPAGSDFWQELRAAAFAMAGDRGDVREWASLDAGEQDAIEVRGDALPGVSSFAVAGGIPSAVLARLNMHKEALGIWPAQHAASVRAAVLASGALPSPMINLVESESEEAITAAAGFPGGFPAEWFANPKFRQLTPLTIDKESGRIFGHLAQWGVCHIGVSGNCVKPPHSRSNYANFLKGVVDTTAGEQPVGCFTYGIGHADPRLRAAAATAHYDRPDAVVAYVNVGEDSYGIWYSGVLRPGVDEALVDEFRAVGAVSGDWRPIGHFGLDLVASVAVNTPGFPVSIAASGGEVTALIAAGMVMQPDPEPESAPESFADANADFLAAAIAKAMDKRENQKREQALRQRAHTIRQADLRRRAQKKG